MERPPEAAIPLHETTLAGADYLITSYLAMQAGWSTQVFPGLDLYWTRPFVEPGDYPGERKLWAHAGESNPRGGVSRWKMRTIARITLREEPDTNLVWVSVPPPPDGIPPAVGELLDGLREYLERISPDTKLAAARALVYAQANSQRTPQPTVTAQEQAGAESGGAGREGEQEQGAGRLSVEDTGQSGTGVSRKPNKRTLDLLKKIRKARQDHPDWGYETIARDLKVTKDQVGYCVEKYWEDVFHEKWVKSTSTYRTQ